MSEISEAAIEAAAKASWETLSGDDAWECVPLGERLPYLADAKVQLEAALPYLLREAKEEAWFEGQYAARLGERIEVDMLNPYRITSVPVPAKVWRDVAAEALEDIARRKAESGNVS